MTHVDRSPERAKQDYVKAIYQLGGDTPVRSADLARYLAVSRAAVTKLRRTLESARLVTRAAFRTDPIKLTARGRALAVRMLRRHRLIETFLFRSLKVPLQDVHRQAESIEHVISDDIAARLARFLRDPHVDPHGHPISAQRGGMLRPSTCSLAAASRGTRLRIESIPDRDASAVRRLVEQRVLPGLTATVVECGKKHVKLRSARGVHTVASRLASTIGVALKGRRRPRR